MLKTRENPRKAHTEAHYTTIRGITTETLEQQKSRSMREIESVNSRKWKGNMMQPGIHTGRTRSRKEGTRNAHLERTWHPAWN